MMRSGSRWVLALAVSAFALVAMGGREARAGYNVVLTGVSGSGSDYTYSYAVSITANQESVAAGNFFRIFDFAGYIPGTATDPAGWSYSVANSNPTPPPNVILQHGDDPGIPNITYTYTASTPITGPATLGTFTAQSVYGPGNYTPGSPGFGALILKDFAGQSTNTNLGTLIDTRGDLLVPVPEPASLVSSAVGVGLLGLFLARRARRKTTA